MKKILSAFIVFVIFCTAFSVTAFADMGPKPSVVVTFKNLGNERCYATLLSAFRGSGPYNSWDSDKEYDGDPESITKAFIDYKDEDGYYYLLHTESRVDGSKRFVMDYYPPEKFKILLYYPDYNLYLVSEPYQTYAFSSYYNVDMTGIDPDNITDEKITLKATTDYNYIGEFFGFALRVIITLLIELYLATKFINKRRFYVILITNLVTQLGLNLTLNIIMIDSNPLFYFIYYIGLEIAIGIIETIVYLLAFNGKNEEKVSVSTITLYALVANFLSFTTGLFIALVYRLIVGLLGIEMIAPVI